MNNLSNQIAFITGATGAIGTAIVKRLHSLGAHIYISGSNMERLTRLGESLGDNYTIKQCDLSDEKKCNALFDDISKLDILVCNAGITRDNLAIRMSDTDFEDVININLKVNFILNRNAIKKMVRNRYGRIVNISSVVAISGNPGQANYCASKAGLIAMTKSLAIESASRNITINAVAPGFIVSEMTNKLNDKQKELILQKIPTKRLGQPEDVANAVSFLVDKESSYITGQSLHINGGMLMV